jgi:lysophospholipase L1-like esterase
MRDFGQNRQTNNMKRFVLLAILLFFLCSCSFAPNCRGPQDTSCTRVLFIGNSYTFVNDLPNTFAKLAKSGGHQVEVGMSAQGAWRLADHIQSSDTLNILNSKKWNFVVLQEQSQIPSIQQIRNQEMYPAARQLAQKIKDIGATPVFFVTWAHRNGMPENGMNNFESMQAQINAGYMSIAQELRVPVAPVGSAWLITVKEHPEFGLWQEDGSHPTAQGTYLAACVFYAVIFQESPDGLNYSAGLSRENAKVLQAVASRTVLNIP